MRTASAWFFSLIAGMAGPVSAGPVLPTGGTVVAGGAVIGTGATRVDVVQSTPRAIVNWNSFSIGSGGTVQFTQPSNTSAVLNRVTGTDPSSIIGTLSANGQVFLMNPNGITIGPGGRVETAGLVLTTASVTDGDFMAGLVRVDAPPTGLTTVTITDGRIDAGGWTISIGMPGGSGLGGTPVLPPPVPPTLGGGTITIGSGGSIAPSGGVVLTGGTIGLAGGAGTIVAGGTEKGGTITLAGTSPSATFPGASMIGTVVSVVGVSAAAIRSVVPAVESIGPAHSGASALSAADVASLADGAVTIRVPLVGSSSVILN